MCVLSGCGNLWGDKDFWYIIAMFMLILCLFRGGGVDPQACGGRGCILIVICVFRSASLNGVYLAFRGVRGSGAGRSPYMLKYSYWMGNTFVLLSGTP